MQHRDGTWHWFLGHDTVFTRTPDGRVEQVIGTAQDITKWKEAEEELAVRQAELVHASRLSTVGRMVAALSHEVAQPLNATGNYAAACQQILDSERDDQRASLREYVNSIVKQNQRCGQILKRLRDFSRRTPAQRSKCDIAHLLRDATELVSFELRRDKVSVRFELASGLQTLWCDRIQLQQVVVNLLTNARDAVRKQEIARREIEVRASAANGAAVIEVDDLGSGLSSDMAARMFEPFYTTKEQGMGIGLSICQSIVKEHGGQIEAYSNRSGGTTVRITIPFDRSDKND
jgi:C4-dicarboxylate-specific signal transduction histidine kinase